MVCPLLPEKCASKIVVFPFGWIGDDHGVKRVKIKVYVANYMYMYNLRQEALRKKAGALGYEMLEEIVIPLGCEYPNLEMTEIHVSLTPTGTSRFKWKPTSDDRKWNSEKGTMCEKNKLPEVFTITDGHLCRSQPISAANFALMTKCTESVFHGNIAIGLLTPNMPGYSQCKQVDVMIPPAMLMMGSKTHSRPSVVEHPDFLEQYGNRKELHMTDFGKNAKGVLDHGHIWELAKRIIDQHQLLNLGLHVLKIPNFTIQSALNNKSHTELAAYHALQSWYSGQNNGSAAYTNLVSGLRKCNMNELASRVTEWVHGSQ